jgi:hypothetical protein
VSTSALSTKSSGVRFRPGFWPIGGPDAGRAWRAAPFSLGRPLTPAATSCHQPREIVIPVNPGPRRVNHGLILAIAPLSEGDYYVISWDTAMKATNWRRGSSRA